MHSVWYQWQQGNVVTISPELGISKQMVHGSPGSVEHLGGICWIFGKAAKLTQVLIRVPKFIW